MAHHLKGHGVENFCKFWKEIAGRKQSVAKEVLCMGIAITQPE